MNVCLNMWIVMRILNPLSCLEYYCEYNLECNLQTFLFVNIQALNKKLKLIGGTMKYSTKKLLCYEYGLLGYKMLLLKIKKSTPPTSTVPLLHTLWITQSFFLTEEDLKAQNYSKCPFYHSSETGVVAFPCYFRGGINKHGFDIKYSFFFDKGYMFTISFSHRWASSKRCFYWHSDDQKEKKTELFNKKCDHNLTFC